MLKELREDLEHLSHFAFYITHDTILAPFVGTCSNQLITKENWFNFLDGICIKKHGDEEIAIYWGTQQFITQGSSK